MKRCFFISIQILILISNLYAKNISFSSETDALFNDSSYSSLIKKATFDVINVRDIDLYFNLNYAVLENEIIAISKKQIVEDLSKVSNSKRQLKTSKAYRIYRQTIYDAVQKVLLKNDTVLQKLLEKNLDDQILDFQSEIHLSKDGKIRVIEKIKVANFNHGNNNLIQRGITRDFPIQYCNKLGFLYSVPFHVNSITRNGEPENFFLENLTNGVRIYCGQSDIILPEGIYEYIIDYTTARQLKFHNNRDEFYWNITGNGWLFKINKVKGNVFSPQTSTPLDMSVYTGKQGRKESNAKIYLADSTNVEVVSTQSLLENEGLTISVSYPKETFIEPNFLIQAIQLLKDNKYLFFIIFFVFIHFILLYLHWKAVGKDPKSGVIIPLFEPPNELSPASVGYINKQSFNDTLFSAALIDLAVKHKINIDVESKGIVFKSNVYSFRANNIDQDDYCKKNYGFEETDLNGITISKGTYNSKFASIYFLFKKHLDNQILKIDEKDSSITKYLSLNYDKIGIGFFALFGIFIATIIYLGTYKPPANHIIFLVCLFLLAVVVQIIFTLIIKAYTNLGRKTADKIQGFKIYLSTTEQDRFERMNPPEMSLQLYEKYLPYAIALNVENEWSEKFNDIVEKAINNGEQPVMYRSYQSMSSSSFSSFTSSLSQGLSSSISSASTIPSSSSSSGSSGGGSSGGGGGGGGGGGW